jgi:hypothetical protein
MIPALALAAVVTYGAIKEFMKKPEPAAKVGGRASEADLPMANDLADWAIWGDHPHARNLDDFKANMLRHHRRGTYDHSKGPILWRHYIDMVHPSYSKSAGGLHISAGTKNLASKILADKFRAELGL